jgi:L-fuconolactonase
MKIIDSHVHFWHPDNLQYDWISDLPLLNRPYLPTDYALATEGLELAGIVFVQADCRPEQGLDEVRWVDTLDAPIQAMVAFAPLEAGATVQAHLEALTAIPRVKSVRRLIQSEGAGFATQPDFIRAVQLLADYNLRFDICIYHHQLSDVIELVRQCPQIQFVLDHGGKPNIKTGELDPWRDDIRTLANFENVSCKISGLVTEANHDAWTVDTLRPYIEHLLESFGVNRLMFGSDYPVMLLASQYKQWVDSLQSILSNLSPTEQNALYSETVQKFYGL